MNSNSITCKQCGEAVSRVTSGGRQKIFCSRQCLSKFHYEQKKVVKAQRQKCVVCAKSFNGPSYKKYCSEICVVENRKATRRKTLIGSPPKNKVLLSDMLLFNELSPNQQVHWDEIKKLSKKSPVILNWQCTSYSNHVWSASVRSRTGGSGCLVCKGNVVISGVNDIASQYPEIVKFWDFDKNQQLPSEVTPFSRKVISWKCTNGHEWLARPAGLVNGKRCGACSNQRVSTTNSLLHAKPKYLSEWDHEKNIIDPDDLVVKSGRRVYWLCEEGHSYRARAIDRFEGRGCPVCAGRVLLPGFNDLKSCFPEIAREWSTRNSMNADQVGKGSPKRAWWMCSTCQREWFAQISNRTHQNTGCPHCSDYGGYDPTSDGYLYLLQKPIEGLQQFGISNHPKRRVKQHEKSGWETLDVLGPADGQWIKETEDALKKFFSSKEVLLTRSYPDKFVGYTETWLSNGFEYGTLKELLDDLRSWEWETSV